ncbi:MAG: hypothetical protein AB7E83_26035, partial [Ramlibacter sp.]
MLAPLGLVSPAIDPAIDPANEPGTDAPREPVPAPSWLFCVPIPLIAGTHSTRWRAAFHRDRGQRSAVMVGSRAWPGVTVE